MLSRLLDLVSSGGTQASPSCPASSSAPGSEDGFAQMVEKMVLETGGTGTAVALDVSQGQSDRTGAVRSSFPGDVPAESSNDVEPAADPVPVCATEVQVLQPTVVIEEALGVAAMWLPEIPAELVQGAAKIAEPTESEVPAPGAKDVVGGDASFSLGLPPTRATMDRHFGGASRPLPSAAVKSADVPVANRAAMVAMMPPAARTTSASVPGIQSAAPEIPTSVTASLTEPMVVIAANTTPPESSMTPVRTAVQEDAGGADAGTIRSAAVPPAALGNPKDPVIFQVSRVATRPMGEAPLANTADTTSGMAMRAAPASRAPLAARPVGEVSSSLTDTAVEAAGIVSSGVVHSPVVTKAEKDPLPDEAAIPTRWLVAGAKENGRESVAAKELPSTPAPIEGSGSETSGTGGEEKSGQSMADDSGNPAWLTGRNGLPVAKGTMTYRDTAAVAFSGAAHLAKVAADVPVMTAAPVHAQTLASRVERLQELVQNFDRHLVDLTASKDSSMTIDLYPPNLGRLTLNCREESGNLYLEVLADNRFARAFVSSHEGQLRSVVENGGFKLAQFDVRAEGEGGDRRQFEWAEARERAKANNSLRRSVPVAAVSGAPEPVRVWASNPKDGLWLVA